MNMMGAMMAASRRRVLDPLTLSPALWIVAGKGLFDATSGGSAVGAGNTIARWEDQSGNDRHFTAANNANRPTRQTGVINGHEVVRFDGINDWMIASFGLDVRSFQRFIVAKANGDTQVFAGQRSTSRRIYQYRQGATVGGTTLNAYSSGEFTGFALFELSGNGTSKIARVNGATESTFTDADTGSATHTLVGAGPDSTGTAPSFGYLNGDIAEMLMFTAPLSTDDRERVERYLNGKYAIY
jgi:hypothetical protein